MCTLSCAYTESGYELWFNRDESRFRLESTSPRQYSNGIWSVDGNSGGTWLGVNQYGVSLALLNGYCGNTSVNNRSRGEIIPLLLKSRTCDDVASVLHQIPLDVFNSFYLWAISKQAIYLWLWDGHQLMVLDGTKQFMTTSSFEPDLIVPFREQRYQQLKENHGWQPYLHYDLYGPASAYSFLMSRPDAKTVSISRICVTEKMICYDYNPVPLLQQSFLTQVMTPASSLEGVLVS